MAANPTVIHPWQDLAQRYSDGLIIGNGGSIAVDGVFSYASLYQAAQDLGNLTNQVSDVFRRFNTQDFELILRRLWQATLVNEALGIQASPVAEAYVAVRDSLIRTVRDSHVSYDRALPHLTPIYSFMRRFRTVACLNYDLIVYWSAMLGNQNLGNWFKDAFRGPLFQESWRNYRTPLGAAGTTMIFYPHGNLALARSYAGKEIKLAARDNQDLLATILDRWSSKQAAPLFVCEGTRDQKRLAIESSAYLRTVHSGPLRELGESVVIYGWSIGEQDSHVLAAVRASHPNRIAVSVHDGNYDFVDRAIYQLGHLADELQFFDAASPGCWITPAADAT